MGKYCKVSKKCLVFSEKKTPGKYCKYIIFPSQGDGS